MNKIMKLLLIAFIVLLACSYISNVYATTVNMNLSGNTNSSTYGSNTTSTSGTTTQGSSTAVSNPAGSNLDALTISDMINIVLCAIGIILILLGIAIIIRQKTI